MPEWQSLRGRAILQHWDESQVFGLASEINIKRRRLGTKDD